MTTTAEIARRLRKSVNGADVMTISDFQRFMGNGMCVQNGCSTGVALTNCNSSYWRSKLYGYRSIL